MAYGYKWKPSRTAKREFAEKMNEIDEYCFANGISSSASSDIYIFFHPYIRRSLIFRRFYLQASLFSFFYSLYISSNRSKILFLTFSVMP